MEPDSLNAALKGGASHVGFVFFPPSPRNLSVDRAAPLAELAKGRTQRVGLFVNPDDDFLSHVLGSVDLDILQLHGDEAPDRVAEIRARWGKPVIKAFKIAEAADLDAVKPYEQIVDYFLFDAKPPKDATRPGGNAHAFDWTLMAGRSWTKPWFLAGGLTAGNVTNAIRLTGAPLVDTSSGVEDSPGQKNNFKIQSFLTATHSA